MTGADGWFYPQASIVGIKGSGSAAFLQRVCTQDMRRVSGEGVAPAALCSPQGELVADFWLWADGREGFFAVIEDGASLLFEETLAKLRLRSDLHWDSSARRCMHVAGPRALGALERVLALSLPPGKVVSTSGVGLLGAAARTPFPGVDILALPAEERHLREILSEAGCGPIEPEVAETLRIACGLPRWGVDYHPGTLFVEVQIPGVFAEGKGCFTGQEAITRMRMTGKPNKQLLAGSVRTPFAPSAGDSLMCGGETAGRITSVAPRQLDGVVPLLAWIWLGMEAKPLAVIGPDGPVPFTLGPVGGGRK